MVGQTGGEHQFPDIMQHPGDVGVFGAGGVRPLAFHQGSCQPRATQRVPLEFVYGKAFYLPIEAGEHVDGKHQRTHSARAQVLNRLQGI
jgi:hypothetical protein